MLKAKYKIGDTLLFCNNNDYIYIITNIINNEYEYSIFKRSRKSTYSGYSNSIKAFENWKWEKLNSIWKILYA